jgi:hypothetical protein
VTPIRRRAAAFRQVWRERTVQGLAAVLLWWAIYLRVVEGYGFGSAIVAATCTAWGYVILSSYVTHVLNARTAGSDRPSGGPRTPTGKWPGARP